ncbi:MAG: ParB N-terminal domain-containing protein, partial [Synergistaceae bacterium]|nr:ParB N-terminal domain-containing protein [Synergistaceae bacterium]
MEIKNMKIADIHPYEKNPRFNDDAVDAVAKSISEFGWRAPIVVDKDYFIVCGHTRLKAAQKLGLTEVPVHVASDLTPEQIQAYRIADNKTAEIAEWNYDLLPLEIKELQGANFDLSLLGFDTDELDRLLNGTSADEVTDGETEPDAVPEVPEEAASCRGEVYRLGEHLLLCGDSTKPE